MADDLIDRLTPAQEAGMPLVRDEWIRHALSTERADRAEAEKGAWEAYKEAGYEFPAHMIWTASPQAGVRAAAALMTYPECAPDMAMAPSDDEVDAISQAVERNDPKTFAEHLRQQFGCALYGQHEAEWLAFYDFFGRFCGIQEVSKLSGLMRIARSAGWWWAFDEAVVMTERPKVLLRDGGGRLHAENGPALAYPDGFGLHSWHGTRVPPEVTTGAGWSVRQIMDSHNVEIRRCAIERMGWEKFTHDSGMSLVATKPDPGNPGQHLTLYDLPEELNDLYEDTARILLCTNGSPEPDGSFHRFGLPVPARHNDPVEAAADLYGLTGEEYARMEFRR